MHLSSSAMPSTHLPTCRPGNTRTHTHTHCGLLLRSHKVTECRYKRAQPSDKWDLACSINSAAKSLLLSIAEPYLSAVDLSYATKAR